VHENNLGREDSEPIDNRQKAIGKVRELRGVWLQASCCPLRNNLSIAYCQLPIEEMSGNKTAPVCTTTVCNQAVCFQNNVTLSILYLPKMKLPVKSSQVVGWYILSNGEANSCFYINFYCSIMFREIRHFRLLFVRISLARGGDDPYSLRREINSLNQILG